MVESPGNRHPCPYCQSQEGCQHLLLLVDPTVPCVIGGNLMEAFFDQLNKLDSMGVIDGFQTFEKVLARVYPLAETVLGQDVRVSKREHELNIGYYSASAPKAHSSDRHTSTSSARSYSLPVPNKPRIKRRPHPNRGGYAVDPKTTPLHQ
jgi:hypothetical protein